MDDLEFEKELAAELYASLGSSRMVRYSKREADSFKPQPHDCHGNVDRWCALHPEAEPERGWLIFEYPLASHPLVRFQAHSIINENGRFVDITPRDGSKVLRFVPHPHGNEMFVLTLSRRRISSLTYKLPR